MKLSNLVRLKDWWSPKLTIFLAIYYTTILQATKQIYGTIIHTTILIVSIIIGAIYVSVLNDLTDIKSDEKSGQKNSMAGFHPIIQKLIIFPIILVGLTFCIFFFKDTLSLIFYISCWICFSLYSIPPFRFKNRKIWGVLVDALGAHGFPSLLVVSNTYFYINEDIDWKWFSIVGIFSFAYGLRGILTHQYNDRLNDAKASIKTYILSASMSKVKKIETIIFIIEVFSLISMLYLLSLMSTIIALIFYIIWVIIRRIKYQGKIAIIITPPRGNYQIILSDFYSFFLPISLLISASIIDYRNLFILFVHIILFPKQLYIVFRDLYVFIRYPFLT